ncbi:MAG: diacylglycerol kinase family lipid kinase [Lactobacillus sp.]|jgi:diacylglycerol kinase (ATP)|nr:diacylglycerol kinase family lipid kinase [Lactobacillus sp.]MCI1481953.1 diacylglycerol kinase family lipid kinase [Lactobacillus sp.]
MVKKARLIYNPASGHEELPQKVADILDILEQAGYEASAFRTKPEPNSAKNEASRCADAGFDLVVAAGGDGTINEVVNGIAPKERRPRMAVIPGGTTNDYARALKIPRDDLVAAAKVILRGKTQKMDIGLAGDTYFMNIAASGSLADLTYGVPSEVKSALGYTAYMIKGAEMLPKVTSHKMRLTYDGGVYEGPVSMFLLGMTNSIGGFERIMPDAQLSDGYFQLIVVKTDNSVEMLRLMVQALNGQHTQDPDIIYTKTKQFKAEVLDDHDQHLPVNLDGENGGKLPMTFHNLQQRIEFYIG